MIELQLKHVGERIRYIPFPDKCLLLVVSKYHVTLSVWVSGWGEQVFDNYLQIKTITS